MTDVRALQAILDGGITDPALILAAMPLDPLEETMKIPDDGKEHDCRCGDGPYRVWVTEWRPPFVTGFEGRPVLFCQGCGAEFEVGP